MMRQVPAVRVSKRLEATGFMRSDWSWESDLPKRGAPATRGWQRTGGDGNWVGAHASTPLRSTLGPGIGEGVERNG
jgi:hypothetical protein